MCAHGARSGALSDTRRCSATRDRLYIGDTSRSLTLSYRQRCLTDDAKLRRSTACGRALSGLGDMNTSTPFLPTQPFGSLENQAKFAVSVERSSSAGSAKTSFKNGSHKKAAKSHGSATRGLVRQARVSTIRRSSNSSSRRCATAAASPVPTSSSADRRTTHSTAAMQRANERKGQLYKLTDNWALQSAPAAASAQV